MEKIIFDSFDMDDDQMEEVESLLKECELNEDLMALCEVSLWDGKRHALVNLSERNKTRNLSLIVRSMMRGHSYITVGVHNGDVIMEEHHHDGTNYYIFRKTRKGSNEDSIRKSVEKASEENFISALRCFKNRTTSIKKETEEALKWWA